MKLAKNNSRHHTMKKNPLMFEGKKKQEKKQEKKVTKKDYVFEKKEISDYFASLSDLEKKAFLIAQDHLESSFDAEKSIGYLKTKN